MRLFGASLTPRDIRRLQTRTRHHFFLYPWSGYVKKSRWNHSFQSGGCCLHRKHPSQEVWMEEKAREQRHTDKSESGTLFKKSSFSRPSIHFFLKKRIEASVGSVLLYSVLRLYIYIYIPIRETQIRFIGHQYLPVWTGLSKVYTTPPVGLDQISLFR